MTTREILRRFNFEPPGEYVALDDASLLDVQAPDGAYLWLFEAEWLQPQQIRTFEFEKHHKPGFVPFAFTGAGDLWCWWPDQAADLRVPVVLCPHDCQEGEFNAPDFSAWLYRRCLEYASGGFDAESERAARILLTGWARRFQSFWPASWYERLRGVSHAPLRSSATVGDFLISPDECDAAIAEDFKWSRLDERFDWMFDNGSGKAP